MGNLKTPKSDNVKTYHLQNSRRLSWILVKAESAFAICVQS